MKIYPDTKFFDVTAKFGAIVGLYPWQFMFPDNNTCRQIYRWYSYIVLLSFIVLLLPMYVELIILLRNEETSKDELGSNLSITIVFSSAGLRALFLRRGSNLINLIQNVMDEEKKQLFVDCKKVQLLEDKCLKVVRKLSYIYAVIVVVAASQKSVTALLQTPTSSTGTPSRDLIISAWFPFDKQEYYWQAYCIQIYHTIIGASYLSYMDIFMFNLLSYPIGQFKKLQFIIKNMEVQHYSYNDSENKSIDDGVRSIIERHQYIIQYVDFYNKSMGTFALFDFLQSSLQIATVLLQFSPTVGTIIFMLIFFALMLLRLFLYYYTANEVSVQSEKVKMAVWESKWYEQPPKIKYALLRIMTRAAKPSKYIIGAFGGMSTYSIIQILKATYTYITIMFR
uniref:Odorant receptor n=1 Tax=Ips typographus TaxID=55986 RepID=A0A8F3ERC7_IPSTY|nr:odorant receptor 25 [Ips typographus]